MRKSPDAAAQPLRHLAARAACFLLLACCHAPTAAAAPVRLQLNELAAVGSPEDMALQFFRRQVAAGTRGSVGVDLHLGGSLGNPQTAVENMMFGELDLFAGNLVHYLPLMIDEVSGLTVPFLVTDDKAIRQYLASPLLDEARDKVLTSRHIRFLEMTAIHHPFHLIASVRPIRKTGDMAGMRISSSVPLQKIIARAWAVLGARYQPLALADMSSALKEGRIDAVLFADLETAVKSGVMAHAHFLTGVDDAPRVWQISVNEAAWQRLSADQRKTLSNAAAQSVALFQKEADRQFRRQIAKLAVADHVAYVELDATGARRDLAALYNALVQEGALNPRVVATANQAMGDTRKDRPQ